MEVVKDAISGTDEVRGDSKVRDTIVQFAERVSKLITQKVVKERGSTQDEQEDVEEAWKGAIHRIYLQYHKQFDPHWSIEESYQCSLLAMLELDRPEQLKTTYIEERCRSRHLNHLREEKQLNRWKYVKRKGEELRKRERTDENILIETRNALRVYGMKDIEQLLEVLTEHNQKFGEIARLILIEGYEHPNAYEKIGVSRQSFHKMKCSAARYLKERAKSLQREAEICELFGNVVASW